MMLVLSKVVFKPDSTYTGMLKQLVVSGNMSGGVHTSQWQSPDKYSTADVSLC